MTKKVREGGSWWAACAVWGVAVLAPNAWAAAGQQTAYFPDAWGYRGAYLVNWDVTPGKASVLSPDGKAVGPYVVEGAARTITYGKPLVIANYSYHVDSCNTQVPTTVTYSRIRFREVTGSSRELRSVITEDAKQVVDSGGDQGKVLWATSVDDPNDYGYAQVQMAARQGQKGLKTGAQLAGLASLAMEWGWGYVPEDIASLQAGRLMAFADAGASYPYRTDAEGWWVLDLPWGQRAYTRLQTDSQGGQTWLMADLVDGKKQWVQKELVASAKPGSQFASVDAAARVWESGIALSIQSPFFAYLYADGTGKRGSPDFFSPLTWSLQSGKVVQDIPYRASSGYKRYRTWQSVQRVGDVRWVMEDDYIVNPDGSTQAFIAKRLVPQVDRGAALPSQALSSEDAGRQVRRPAGMARQPSIFSP